MIDKLKEILPKEGVDFYTKAYNESVKKGNSDAFASKVAWDLTKSRMKNVGDKWIALSEDFAPKERFVFELEKGDKEFIVNSENGEITLNAVLTSKTPNKKGRYFDIEDLEYIAKQINEEGSTLPDEEHLIYKELANNRILDFLSDDELKALFKQRKGVFKSIKAAVKEGKLWIQANLDKRYKNHVNKFNNLSIEAVGRNVNNRMVKPVYLGFTFTDTPSVIDAKIIK